MGDRFLGLFCFAAPRPGRRKAAKFFRAGVDDPEVDIGEADDPVAVLVFRNPYWLADERLTDEDEVAGPFDLTLAAYPPHRVIGVVPRFFDVIRVWPCRCAVAASGRGLVK